MIAWLAAIIATLSAAAVRPAAALPASAWAPALAVPVHRAAPAVPVAGRGDATRALDPDGPAPGRPEGSVDPFGAFPATPSVPPGSLEGTPVPFGGAEPGEAMDEDVPDAAEPFRFNPPPSAAGTPREGEPPAVRYGADELPAPVAAIRERLLEAAASGDIERLRPIFAGQDRPPVVAFDSVDDPVAHLRRQSGDPNGREILAILIELLSTGWVVVDPGTARETYVWPYFAHVPLPALTPGQEVELYKVLTAVDVEEMAVLGEYAFYRVGIAPDGTIRYFSAEGF